MVNFNIYACSMYIIVSLTNAIREIPSSIVKAIAEGNLNPSTKKAFDESESSRFPLHPNDLQSFDQVQKAEVPTPSRPKNSFSIIASQYTRENSTGKQKLWICSQLL